MTSYSQENRLLTEEDAPQMNENLDSIVVVDGLPVVDQKKFEKLRGVVKKVFAREFEVVDVTLAQGEEGGSLGFAFVEFFNPETAAEALASKDGHAFDKKHTFQLTLLRNFDKFINTPETWEPPAEQEYDAEQENLWSWTLDEACRDQYVTREGPATNIFWNTRNRASAVESRENWSDAGVAWSPRGTYLATFHRRGIALWGGSKWKRLARFSHNGVRYIDFSPCERYLVTLSTEAPDTPKDPQAIIIWDIKTGQKKRGFQSVKSDFWPVFKWSHDDKYFAKLGENMISVYETPSMGLLNKKSIKIEGVVDFRWSPTDNLLSYWVPEVGHKPARVVILAVPKREEVAARNLYSVKECKMNWQENGDYLCVKVDRYTRSKKGQFTNFELFHLREKLIPCDSLEIKDQIDAFAWEPVGNKFAIIHANQGRCYVSFYQLQAGGVTLLKTFDKMTADSIFWSPRGQYVVVAGMAELGGDLEFIDTSDMTILNHGEHFKCTDIEWDPTGRYVASVVSHWRFQVDTGFFMWTFQGRLLQKHMGSEFCQLLWRPKQKSPLDKDDLKAIQDDWRSYQSRFEAEDKMTQIAASGEQLEKRRKQADSWEQYRRHCVGQRAKNLHRVPTVAGATSLLNETVEVLVDTKVEVVQE